MPKHERGRRKRHSRTPVEHAPEMESAMGGTSDAGSAADDAAEAAEFDRGLPDDETRRTGHIPGARPNVDEGTRGTSGGTTPLDSQPMNVDLDHPPEPYGEE